MRGRLCWPDVALPEVEIENKRPASFLPAQKSVGLDSVSRGRNHALENTVNPQRIVGPRGSARGAPIERNRSPANAGLLDLKRLPIEVRRELIRNYNLTRRGCGTGQIGEPNRTADRFRGVDGAVRAFAFRAFLVVGVDRHHHPGRMFLTKVVKIEEARPGR